MSQKDPVAAADKQSRALARGLLAEARFASLAVTDPETRTPAISRIAFGLDLFGAPVTLISSLSAHHGALSANPDCALMVGEPEIGRASCRERVCSTV